MAKSNETWENEGGALDAEADSPAEREKEQRDAAATPDPNDDLAAATTDVGREVSVATPFVIDAEEPEEPTVKVKQAESFKVPVLEEYEDEQGRPRGRVKDYETPSDVKVFVASAEADADYTDDDGYVVLPAEVPASVAADLVTSPAVEVDD